MREYDEQYLNTVARIMDYGYDCPDRTGTGCRKVFDVNISASLERTKDALMSNSRAFNLPLLGLRKIHPRPYWMELFWMLSGSTDATVLQKKNIHIWDANSSREFLSQQGLHYLSEGNIGDGYGKQFRNFGGVDQLKQVMTDLVENPYSRRHFISLWNPPELPTTALAPCHTTYNFVVTGKKLNLKFYQRSSDFILAGGANFVFASFFLTWMADRLGFEVGSVAHSISDCHIYTNHFKAAIELIENREPIDFTATFQLPESRHDLSTREVIDENLDIEIADMLNDDTWNVIKETISYRSHPTLPKELLPISA